MRIWFLLWAVALASIVMNAQQQSSGNSVSCRTTTTPPGVKYGSEFLQTALWPEGRVVFAPGGLGSVLNNGALEMKFPWWRLVSGDLTIEGHRLDGIAPPLQADVPKAYGASGFQATGLIFPTVGCWQVTGRVGEGKLTFVTEVVKIGGGPR